MYYDYAPEILKLQRKYAEVKSTLKKGAVLYGLVEEVTGDMAKR